MPNFVKLQAYEDTVTTETTLNFDCLSGKIVIINDHATENLYFKYNILNEFCTIYPGESVSAEFSVDQITIDGAGVPYRIWVYS